MRRLPSIRGAPPSLARARPPGCAFQPRCDFAREQCREEPELESHEGGPGHLARCWFPNRHREMADQDSEARV
jgi:oligopeptide/dipeptide ABC transporter ATP-binding protein